MRKLCLLLVAAFMVLASGDDAMAQFRRSNIKKNNKRIASFRGKKSGFGREKRYNAIGFSVNALNYYGDISTFPQKVSTTFLLLAQPLAFLFAHRFGPRYTLQAQFLYGTLSGSDTKSASPSSDDGHARYLRNASFRNRIKEFSVVAYFDLFPNESTYISRVKWTPYYLSGYCRLSAQSTRPGTCY